ncbi:MAG: MmcB family DNA repair protein [Alphaproteobacteria bacterium]|nr:MmcB family DNA repair protein [Alphaproteobacteria bacterium]
MDGRQSETALQVQRGVCRLLYHMGFSCLSEFTLRTGRRVDLAGLGPKGQIWAIEIKSSLADFRTDTKWPDYLDYCDRFYFAVPQDFPLNVLPEEQGVIVADLFGGEIVRDAPEDPMAAARRKAVTLLFARTAAHRMQRAIDPDLPRLD